MIIDCHSHLSIMDKNEDFKQASLKFNDQMRTNKIDKAIIIADNVAGSGCANVDVLLAQYSNNPSIYIVGALYIYKNKPENIQKMEHLLKNKKIIALKLFPGHDKVYPTDKRCLSTYELCLKYNVPVIIHTGINSGDFECAKYNDPKHIIKIAKKYPELKIILAHYFWPQLDYCYEMTKDIKNIFYDTSALADDEVIQESGGIEKMREVLTKTVKDKPNGVVFGTDYPMCDVCAHINLINSLDISNELKDKIFYKNAFNLFALK